jgi:hypothetical protein
MKTYATTKKTQSIVEIFIEEMNQIYYPGYVEDHIASDTQKFEWEFNEYQAQFSKK